jgi:hypothetical protein
MAKKKKKPKGGRPANWQEICMERVPTGTAKASEPKEQESPEPEPEKAEKASKATKR